MGLGVGASEPSEQQEESLLNADEPESPDAERHEFAPTAPGPVASGSLSGPAQMVAGSSTYDPYAQLDGLFMTGGYATDSPQPIAAKQMGGGHDDLLF